MKRVFLSVVGAFAVVGGAWALQAPAPIGAAFGNFSQKMVQAFGGSTYISLAERFGWSLTPQDFGAKADGVANDTAAIQSAIDAGSSATSTVIIPKGIYAITGSLIVPSDTTIVCEAGAVLKETTNDSVFINTNANRQWLTDYTAPTTANMTDHDISISGCTADFTTASSAKTDPNSQGAGFADILLASNVHIFKNKLIGDTTGKNHGQVANMIRVSKSTDVDVHDNYGTGLYNGFGAWGGVQRIHAYDNTWFIAPNTFNSNPYSCSNINGVGTAPGDHQTSRDITYDHNTCFISGGSPPYTAVAYNNGSGSSGSQIINFDFSHNLTIASGVGNTCYNASGALEGLKISNNRFENCDVSTFVLSAHGVNWGAQANPFTTVSGSPSVTVSVANVTPTTVSVGNYAWFSGATAVGGLTLNGKYPITAVSSGSFTIDAGANATSSATGGGGSVNVSTSWGTVRDSLVANNVFVNSNSPNNGEIVVEGPNNVVENNVVEGGDYGSVTLTSSYDCCSSLTPIPTLLSGNRGVAGTGVTSPTGGFGVSGDNINAYQTGYAPTILDKALTSVAATAYTPAVQLGSSSTGWTFTTNGYYWQNGKTVNVCFSVDVTTVGTATGNLRISLPATATSDWGSQPIQVMQAKNLVGVTLPALDAAEGTQWIYPYVDNTMASHMTDANLKANSIINGCGSYQTY